MAFSRSSRLLSKSTDKVGLSPFDHRSIGQRQNLFFFNSKLSPGSCFFEPRGTRIYNKLLDFIRSEYRKRDYHEVITPNVFKNELWNKSGHWQYYSESMIKLEGDMSLKPMNCPSHCIMFNQRGDKRSTDLPIRWADFGVLHRNENSGTLLGLTRVRRFQQDDAHIFCTPDQIEHEISSCLDFAKFIYSKFDLEFDVELSTRPEKYLGSQDLWDKAEVALRLAIEKSNLSWTEQKFEAAFYGPKIDLKVRDCRGKTYQCATIQLDFQLPERFDLSYCEASNLGADSVSNDLSEEPVLKKLQVKKRPVIIHRAMLGSIERFIAMIAEHTKGRWPFWMSPFQAQVIPIHTKWADYAKSINQQLKEAGFWTDCDLSAAPLRAKISNAISVPYNLILIVGANEAETKSITCRVDVTQSNALSNEKDLSIHHIKISSAKLIEYLKQFEKDLINRADLELLALNRR